MKPPSPEAGPGAFAFTPRTHESLTRAGWTTGYAKDPAKTVMALEKLGYTAHPAALSFLARFGGLEVEVPHPVIPGYMDSFHFKAKRAARLISPASVARYVRAVGPLCPIGAMQSEHMVLFMDEAGHIYAGADRLLLRVGDDAVGALETLCTYADMDSIDLSGL